MGELVMGTTFASATRRDYFSVDLFSEFYGNSHI